MPCWYLAHHEQESSTDTSTINIVSTVIGLVCTMVCQLLSNLVAGVVLMLCGASAAVEVVLVVATRDATRGLCKLAHQLKQNQCYIMGFQGERNFRRCRYSQQVEQHFSHQVEGGPQTALWLTLAW